MATDSVQAIFTMKTQLAGMLALSCSSSPRKEGFLQLSDCFLLLQRSGLDLMLWSNGSLLLHLG